MHRTRFQQEISGSLGEYWRQSALKDVQDAINDANKNAAIDSNGAIYWKNSGKYLMDDFCEKLEYADYPFNREATRIARDIQVTEELAEYRKNHKTPSLEEIQEMRTAFGDNTHVIDIITGEKISL